MSVTGSRFSASGVTAKDQIGMGDIAYHDLLTVVQVRVCLLETTATELVHELAGQHATELASLSKYRNGADNEFQPCDRHNNDSRQLTPDFVEIGVQNSGTASFGEEVEATRKQWRRRWSKLAQTYKGTRRRNRYNPGYLVAGGDGDEGGRAVDQPRSRPRAVIGGEEEQTGAVGFHFFLFDFANFLPSAAAAFPPGLAFHHRPQPPAYFPSFESQRSGEFSGSVRGIFIALISRPSATIIYFHGVLSRNLVWISTIDHTET
ncbi:hypothetical protein N7532_005078 [Penicillium argentinense]|uniref:Uncharacterized protein n=1 Tax=Penicillium argentinense TaxID=1131581 RepID=A0A9W9FDS3_9EURO|nr:uncharacterized protein N7532_005078 [Penicillium argentinense]KAJ5098077.1 hypothetical protein N7532_005078 [Penicillium argentinense]